MLLDVVVRAALPLRMRQTCSEWLERRARAFAPSDAKASQSSVAEERREAQPLPQASAHRGKPREEDDPPPQQEEARWNELRLDLLEQQIALLTERVRRSRPRGVAEESGVSHAPGAATNGHQAVAPEPFRGVSPSEPSKARSHSGVRASADSVQQGVGAGAPCATRIASGGPVLAGTLAGLSLGTLLNVLEYEGCSGRLTLSRDHRYLQVVMQGGGIVSAELDGAKVTIREGVRAVCGWESAGFEFRSEFSIAQPQSGVSPSSLMLEIMSAADAEAG